MENIQHSEAQLLQAEAFFNTCQFEGAYIHFQRGHRVCPTNTRFSGGLADCTRVLTDTTRNEVYCFKELPEFIHDVTKHLEEGHSLDEYSGITVRNEFNMIN